MKKYILGIDQGTTSTRAFLFDKDLRIVAKTQKEIKQYYPNPGWVEQDPSEIWLSVLAVISTLFSNSGIDPSEVESIGITNQRETTLIWDKHTETAIYPAIVWQSRQTEEICERLRKNGFEKKIREKTGLVIDPYFSGTKVAWILENVQGAREAAEKGKLLFGTIDTWILWKLTGGKVHATDYSNASRTQLFNIRSLEWDNELLEELKIPRNMLPEVKESSGVFGKTVPYHFFGREVPISGIAGDQQAALYAQGCIHSGMMKNTYGTGCFLLMQTEDKIVESKNGLLTTIAWKKNGKISYALEGSVFIAGSAIQWLRDGLKILEQTSQSEQMARKAKDSQGLVVVPAFTGLGAPYWKSKVRGSIFGLTRGTTEKQLTRATLEAIAFESFDLIHLMQKESGIELQTLCVDGGASANNYLMQFQSDILNIEIERNQNVETTVTGAALLAGEAVGFYQSQDLESMIRMDEPFIPNMEQEVRKRKLMSWKRAIEATLYYHGENNEN